ncbi:MAG: NAD(P)H-hydrate dehydratase [Phycisphaerales bacterium]|nr:MAG: NAD(P)H-hydrate dehydratase [Phycisphaerales bacterium]
MSEHDSHPPHQPSPLPRVPARDPKGHKGTFGTVLVVGGCCRGDARMIGAPALSAHAALRAGAGLVQLAMPAPIIQTGISLCPSATGLALRTHDDGSLITHEAAAQLDEAMARATAVAVGMGLGDAPDAAPLVLRLIQQEDAPVVIDADALNVLAQVPDLWRDFRAPCVLTPHPGEFQRLASAFRVTHDPTDAASRPLAAEALAQRLGAIVVLKGAGTVVSNGHETWVCDRGHACLATAGTGDVLAGVIASLAAQHAGTPPSPRMTVPRLSLFDIARLGVQAHALAGEMWASRHDTPSGLLAMELADLVPEAIESLRRT